MRDPYSTIWDANKEKLVRAESEADARRIANECVGDEGTIWTDPTKASCVILTPEGESGEIMANYLSG